MYTVLLVLQVVLFSFGHSQFIVSAQCMSDNDCHAWQSCINNICVSCQKPGATCGSSYWSCCEGTTCEDIPGSNMTWCMPNHNKCHTDSDCSNGLNCLLRIGKCGICKPDNQPCTLPYDNRECCSNFCDLTVFPEQDGVGLCKNIFLNSCSTWYDCQSNFDCQNGKCVKCQRFNSYCRVDEDCCSGKCNSNHNFFGYTHRKICNNV